MKKYFYIVLVAVGAMFLGGCNAAEGTKPGNDSNPHVTIYQINPGVGYNADEDVLIRFAANNKASEIYYLVELETAKESFIAQNGAAAYENRVIENGTKITVGATDEEVLLTGMPGYYSITAVAAGSGGAKKVTESVFYGLSWTDVVDGIYTFASLSAPYVPATVSTTLQVCDTDENLYRLKDIYGPGYGLKFWVMTDYILDEDDDGNTIAYCRIEPQATGLNHSTYGAISIRDVGYWQSNTLSWITGNVNYTNYFYLDGPDKYYFSLVPQYYVSAGNLGVRREEFAPN